MAKSKNLLRRRLNVFWNVICLEEYMTCRIIPRGLRVQIFPSFEETPTEFKTQWEQVLHECSCKLMLLLKKHNLEELESIKLQQKQICDQLKEYELNEEFKRLDNDLKTFMENLNIEIMQVKKRKFERDTHDYDNQNVYLWNKKKYTAFRNRGYRGGNAKPSGSHNAKGTSRQSERDSYSESDMSGRDVADCSPAN
ncbi:hypothetical protein XELAEV_18008149mg [Xenopus laevis]|uniref:Uncharacterized protein n=1 Tax=Xenopus laevis TaxID=8355 RepID=A0A974E378_XENLA|nr:hypothetical protein XELAEV_18008149mg [Xenopus laevis]